MNFKFSPHTLFLRTEEGVYLLYQLLTRKGVIVNDRTLNDINNSLNEQARSGNMLMLKDISTFSLSECLLDNPNGLMSEQISVLEATEYDAAFTLLTSHSIIVSDDFYVNRLGKKENLFDKVHIGNFHQQIGQYVLLNQDINSEMWWITQKFSNDFKTTTDTPYKWVQEVFMEDFFTSEKLSGKKILDFGCGIGYYSKFFSNRGGVVTGVDPSQLYIDIAEKEFSDGKIIFRKENFEKQSDFDVLDSNYDIIFLSDVFLYYFEPYKKMELTPSILLKMLSRSLSKNGKIYIMDPHGIFHLQPWFNKAYPFITAVEYANRKYRVTPNLEEVSIVVEEAGLVISKIRELKYNGDDKAKRFYSEFPFWWFFELSKISEE